MSLPRILCCAAVVSAALGMATTELAAQSPGFSGNSVKIGVLTDMSSINAHMGGPGAVTAVQLAIEDAGPIGVPVEMVSADHQAKPDVGASIARKWYENDGVDMITELTNSAVALAVQNLARSLKKVDLVTGGVADDLVGKSCSPWGIHWTFDTFSLANGTTRTVVQQGGKKWFFITADYAFGHAMEARATAVIKAMGGTVVGGARVPQGTADLSSYLLQAQASGAEVIALANAGTDFATAVKQANEFGITQSGKRLVATIIFIPEIDSIGLESAQGLALTTNFYWDRDEASRAFATRFTARAGRDVVPTEPQAAVYSATLHYLKAVKAAGTDDATAVIAKMKEIPIEDFFARNASIREDGVLVHDLLLLQVKTPAESKKRWDYYKVLSTISGKDAFLPLSESTCPHVKKG